MYEYPIFVHEKAGSFWSLCPDIPEAHSAGETKEELLLNAVAGIESALSLYVSQRKPIPLPSARGKDQDAVALPLSSSAKITLWNAMCERNMSRADLAELLGLSHTATSRLVDFEHKSKIEQVEAALQKLKVSARVLAKSRDWISLPYGGNEAGFYVQRLVDVIKELPNQEMVIGAINDSLPKVKTYSLDFLLRTRYARNSDTKQAVAEVIDALVASGYFVRKKVKDPENDRSVEGLLLL